MICVLARMDISFIFIFMNTMFIAVNGESRLISAHHQPDYDNKYEVKNAIGTYLVRFVECSIKCLSDMRCLSFFYNNLTRVCYLHSDPFTYSVMYFSEKGWNFYLSKERDGRCLINFFYYRELDLRYTLEPLTESSIVYEDSVCPGSELMRIERHDYIKLVTADIGGVYNYAICIQGKKIQEKWMYNDGSPIEFLRWQPGQPSGKSNHIVMVRVTKYKFRNPDLSNLYV